MRPYTDSQRLDGLAEAISRLVIYETAASGNRCKIDFRSTVQKGNKKHGMNPDMLRRIADGLLEAREP
jgi:hypothetical protein